MKSAYLDYAMSVIVGRALPDARDGLKAGAPPHLARDAAKSPTIGTSPTKNRRASSAMCWANIIPIRATRFTTRSCAWRKVSVCAARWSTGKATSARIDGDNAAAMRYTEVRMAKIAHALLEDIDRDTVDFVPNYDGADKEPVVLPARFPNLLINGSTGIAVGMATSIPPHNPGECIDACLHLLRRPKATWRDLAKIVRAPDFPTGGIICGVAGAHLAYKGERGRVIVRARV